MDEWHDRVTSDITAFFPSPPPPLPPEPSARPPLLPPEPSARPPLLPLDHSAPPPPFRVTSLRRTDLRIVARQRSSRTTFHIFLPV